MRKLLALALLASTALFTACSSQPSAAYQRPVPGKTAPEPTRPEVPLLLEDLDGDGAKETIAGQRFDQATYRTLVVKTEDGKELLRLDNPPAMIVNVLVVKTGSVPALVVAMTGGDKGHLLKGYLFDKTTGKMNPLKWAGQEGEYLTGLARFDQASQTLAVSVKSADGKTFKDTHYRVAGDSFVPAGAIPK